MFAITEGTRRIGGIEISTYKREVVSTNILEVEAGTNGYQGGDGGHGSRTYFRIKDIASTEMDVRITRDKYGCEGLEVTLGGDCELETIITALKFITNVLEDGAKEVHD